MAASRALPDLVARLKLDRADLQAASREVQGFGATSRTHLKSVATEASHTEKAFASLRVRMGDMVSGSIGMVGAIAPIAAIGGAAGAVGLAMSQAIVPAASFEQQMVKLVGTAGESEGNLKMVSQTILGMAGTVGYSAGELADAMYGVESAGFHGSAGLYVLSTSAQAAKAENADLSEVTDAVTTALNAYGMAGNQASHVTDVLLTATAQGKMTFQDLAGSLDQVLPSASAAKIGLNEVAAAIATQTAQGTPAAVAATNLQYAIKGLQVPSSTAAQAIEQLGLKSNTFADELGSKGLLATLDDLTASVGKKFPAGSAEYNAAISNILGNQEGLNAVLELSGTHAKTFSDNLTGMNSAAGKTQSSFNEMMDTVGGKWSKFTAGLQAEGIQIGTELLPLIGAGLDQLQGAFSFVVDWVTANWPRISATASQVWSTILQGWNAVAPMLKVELPAAISAVSNLFGFLRTHSDLVHDSLLAVGAAAAVLVGAVIGVGVVITGALAGLEWLYEAYMKVTGAVDDATAAIGRFIGKIHDAQTAAKSIPVIGGLLSATGIPGFAEGGVLPGYAPGADSILARLSPGEGILTPQAVHAIGAGAIARLNEVTSGGSVGSYGGQPFNVTTSGANMRPTERSLSDQTMLLQQVVTLLARVDDKLSGPRFSNRAYGVT